MAAIARFHILQQSSSVLKPTVISSKFPHQSSLPPFYCNPSFFRNNTRIRKLHLTPSGEWSSSGLSQRVLDSVSCHRIATNLTVIPAEAKRQLLFLDWEVKAQIEKVKAEIGEYGNNPEALLFEAIHSAGYAGGLGNPLLASEGLINRINTTANYTAPRMVLAASGVEHEELLKYAEPLLSDLPGGAQVQEPKSVYVGGDHRVMADTGRTSFALAFELPGG
ncbi:unnamed protein product [Lactuca virosa]|uniref:Mitochondrial-processing peptidase subunit alpha n=1 Tax=Lactuca virosa TaxID=75947 RepID=A0AAU9NQJ4_9ASTR|nr:unnamed protein product [Lactuca virosa]